MPLAQLLAIQPWLTVAGLLLDAIGFLLLLREWWLGFFSEGRQLEFEQQLERQRSLRNFAQSHGSEQHKSHLERSGRTMDELAVSRARSEHVAARGARKGVFILAAVLVAAGFALQIAGAWPLPQPY